MSKAQDRGRYTIAGGASIAEDGTVIPGPEPSPTAREPRDSVEALLQRFSKYITRKSYTDSDVTFLYLKANFPFRKFALEVMQLWFRDAFISQEGRGKNGRPQQTKDGVATGVVLKRMIDLEKNDPHEPAPTNKDALKRVFKRHGIERPTDKQIEYLEKRYYEAITPRKRQPRPRKVTPAR
jgi:hypothetical protein